MDTWPSDILADVGDLQIRFENRSFWTLYRIDYQGTRLCKDNCGSHYRTVVSFPGVGFIGSGHTENANEEVLALSLEVDGKPVAKPETKYTCQKICLKKESKIRDLQFRTTITVSDGRILEDVVMKADKPTQVDRIYHFMHPWGETATDYLAVAVKHHGAAVERGVKVSRTVKGQSLVRPVTLRMLNPGQEVSGNLQIRIPKKTSTGDSLITAEVAPVKVTVK